MRKEYVSSGPVCETSERTQKLFTEEQMDEKRMDTANRVLEAFDHRPVLDIACALKIDCGTVRALISGDAFPTVDLLIAIREVTGVSIDWLLFGYTPLPGPVEQRSTPAIFVEEARPMGLA